MSSFDSKSSLEDLIHHCISADSIHHQQAWLEFFRRYKEKIYQIVLYRCKSWHSAKLQAQLKDAVNDIVSEVFITLPRALASFKGIDNEKSFLAFISTICSRTVSHYLKKCSFEKIVDYDLSETNNLPDVLAIDNRWEMFDLITAGLAQKSSLRKNATRDKFIFLLYTWANFSANDLQKHPCFKDISMKIVDNVVTRARKVIKMEFS